MNNLGDKVKRVTDAVGIKQCGGCRSRQETLNVISRRGLIGGTLAAIFLAKNSILKAAWKVTGSIPPADYLAALGFVRTCNTAQRQHWKQTKGGALLNRADMLTFVWSMAEKASWEPGWFPIMAPSASEILPGWKLHFANVPYGQAGHGHTPEDGYRLILEGPTTTYITDEVGVIFSAQTPPTVPDPASLPDASAFPGAEGIGGPTLAALNTPVMLWDRLRAYFTPVYAAGMLCFSCCDNQTCCSACGCASCLVVHNCGGCQPGACTGCNPLGSCGIYFNLGFSNCGGFDCTWYQVSCSQGSGCNKCAAMWADSPCASCCGACCQP
jgi:hypothetical protein